jgi:uncharacterized membrane protein
MSTPSRIGKHPVHLMLVTMPIGLWVFALVSDLGHRLGGRGDAWDSVAPYCTAMPTASAWSVRPRLDAGR